MRRASTAVHVGIDAATSFQATAFASMFPKTIVSAVIVASVASYMFWSESLHLRQ